MGQLTLGMDVGPALNALADTMITFVGGNLLPAIWNILSALPGALVTFIQALGPKLLPAIAGIFSQISGSLASGTEMLTMVSTMLSQLGAAITTNAPLIFEGGKYSDWTARIRYSNAFARTFTARRKYSDQYRKWYII